MRYVTLGRTGLRVSAVGFGGIPIQRVSDARAVRAIRAALDLGVNFFDTAAGYADSQRKIGEGIKGRRDGLVIATKSSQRSAEGIASHVEQALVELGVETIDLFQLHGVNNEEKWNAMSAPGGALEGLIKARQAGKIAHIGFSCHSLDFAIKLIEEPIFETIQFPFNLVTREPADELIPKARRCGAGFIVMKPLCGGQYDNARLAFKFLNDYPDLVPIPGIERPEEISEIAPIVESGDVLTGAERTEAEQIASKLGKLFCRRCGYCQPCPQGVPITQAMVFDSFVRRMPTQRVLTGPAKNVAEKAALCKECGQCEEKCPYELPIIETINRSLESARKFIEDHTQGVTGLR